MHKRCTCLWDGQSGKKDDIQWNLRVTFDFPVIIVKSITRRPFSCFCGTMVLHVNICGLLFVGFSDVIGDNTDIIFGNLKRPQTRNGKEET